MAETAVYRDIPICQIDIQDFSLYKGREHKRAAMQDLQRILKESARFFLPHSDPERRLKRHGTGDGYYFFFEAEGPQVALRYALEIRQRLVELNRGAERDLPLRVRTGLAFGDVEWVGDQLLSDPFIESARLVDDGAFKRYAKDLESPASMIMDSLFHHKLQAELRLATHFEELVDLQWTPVDIVDKHGETHKGYVLGPGWSDVKERPALAPPKVRVTILTGHFLEDPLPEAVEMAKRAATSFRNAALDLDVRFDVASVQSLRRTAAAGCDVLVYYGHGTEDGLLSFEDGRKAYSHLADTRDLVGFWASLQACFVFACYGDRFAAGLPCPWVAFSSPVLRLAPKGFLQATVDRLAKLDLRSAVEEARAECESRMRSDFAGSMRLSPEPLPEMRFPPGRAVFSRLSPGLANRARLDFENIQDGDSRYPDDDPFVGRLVDLRSLLRLPSTLDDGPLQRVIWIHGDAGMGKSALLRQLAIRVRDLTFRDEGDPVYLLHLYCYRHTRPTQVVDSLREKAQDLYRFPEAPKDLATLFQALEDRPGVHVWILDDLNYLAVRPDGTDEAAQLVNRIRSDAWALGLPMELVASARRPGPPVFEEVRLEPLTFGESQLLAKLVWDRGRTGSTPPADLAGAARLFAFAGGATGPYKRALTLAAERGISYGDYADGLASKGGLEEMAAADLARWMVDYEVGQLRALEPDHGFAYGSFLRICFPLLARAAYFTEEELMAWFGDSLRAEGDRRPLPTAYRNGLTTLTRLNFLFLQSRPEGTAYAMPPNQRLPLRALGDQPSALPDGVPLRGAAERLSLALERAKTVGLETFRDFLEMEEDYSTHLSDPSAAAAVFYSMLVRAEIAASTPSLSGAETPLSVFDHIAQLYDQHRRGYPADETAASSAVAMALFNKGGALGSLDQLEKAMEAYDEVVRRFGERTEMEIAELVAKALVNKGVMLRSFDQPQMAIEVYDEVVRRLGERTEAEFAENVARALVNKGVTLGSLNQLEKEAEAYDEVVRRFGERTETEIAEQVVRALFNKGVVLGSLDQPEKEIEVYDEVVRRFGEETEPEIAELVAKALFNKGGRLGNLDQPQKAIEVYDQVVRRFGERTETEIAEQVAKALVNKGMTLGSLYQSEKAIEVYDGVVRCFGERTEPEIAEKVARALANKALALGTAGRIKETVAVVGEMSRRFGDSLAAQLANALKDRGIRLEDASS